ncbi:MAG TPA: carbohydrate binding family 9 domain-containing protein [Blastocatellia bacterium]
MLAQRGSVWLSVCLCAAALTSYAQPLSVGRFATAPTIDGRLDEPAWREAAALRDFHQTQPGDNTAPTYPTTIMLGYDRERLYLGIHAVDDPKKVRATVAKRDDITSDDYIAIYLDTFNDRRRAYLLMFNPLGAQQDGLFSEGSEPDFSVDVVMESKGALTEDGYSIEVAIPFKSLRYEAGKGKLWGVHALRYIRHLDEEDSWAPLRRDKTGLNIGASTEARARFLAQAGHITGLEEVATERVMEIIPALTAAETGRRARPSPPGASLPDPSLPDKGRFINQPVSADAGLTGKVRLTPGVTFDFALNPDFAEVEADRPQITANQRFPLFFEERRPFFLEGADIFRTPIQAFHSRTIIDPDVALKLSGKRGRTNFGALLASDNAPGNFSEDERNDPAQLPAIARFIDHNAYSGVLRVRRDVGDQSSVGLTATSYNFIEDHNQLGGVDGRLSLDRNTFFTFQLLGTTSRRSFYDPEKDRDEYRTGNGFAYFTELNRTGRRLNLQLSGEGYTRDYRADLGFTSRTDTNRWTVYARYNSEPQPQRKLISWSAIYTTLVRFDWRGRSQYAYHFPRVALNFRRQTFLQLAVYRDYERLFEEEFGAKRTATRAGAFFGPAERSTFWNGYTITFGTSPSRKYSANVIVDGSWKVFDYDLGAGPQFRRVSPAALADPNAPLDPGPGNTNDITASFVWRPTETFRASIDYTKSRLVRIDTRLTAYDQNLWSLRASYYFTRFTFARARVDYDTLAARARGQFLLGWTPHPGTSFYVGYNDDLNYNGYNPFTGQFERGLRRNQRTFFVKMSYLLRRGL